MQLIIMSVRDSKSETFGRPFFAASKGMGLRAFDDEINREHPDNIMYHHPHDFSLWCIGTFEDSDGTILPDVPKLLINGAEVKKSILNDIAVAKANAKISMV